MPKNAPPGGDVSPTLMREIDALIETKVRESLARIASSHLPTHFTSSPHGEPPPGKTRRWLREHAPEILGASKVGQSWVISREDFERWAARQRPRRASRPVAGPWSPSAALEAAGVRPSQPTL